jgi:DNA-binding LacI/PurR family transcriptional regulator
LDVVFAGDYQTGGLAGNLVVGGLNRQALQRLAGLPCPVQFVDVLVSGEDLDAVRIDYASGTRQAIEHLKSLGHEDIGFIGFPARTSMKPTGSHWRSAAWAMTRVPCNCFPFPTCCQGLRRDTGARRN